MCISSKITQLKFSQQIYSFREKSTAVFTKCCNDFEPVPTLRGLLYSKCSFREVYHRLYGRKFRFTATSQTFRFTATSSKAQHFVPN